MGNSILEDLEKRSNKYPMKSIQDHARYLKYAMDFLDNEFDYLKDVRTELFDDSNGEIPAGIAKPMDDYAENLYTSYLALKNAIKNLAYHFEGYNVRIRNRYDEYRTVPIRIEFYSSEEEDDGE